MSFRRQTLLARVNWYIRSSLQHIIEITNNKFCHRDGPFRQVSLYHLENVGHFGPVSMCWNYVHDVKCNHIANKNYQTCRFYTFMSLACQPRQQCKLGQRWPNVGTTVPTLGQRWAKLHCCLGGHLPCDVPEDLVHVRRQMWITSYTLRALDTCKLTS